MASVSVFDWTKEKNIICEPFWMHTITRLKKCNATIARLNDSEIMLGYTKEKSQWTDLNNILLVGKQAIYSNRLRKQDYSSLN